MPATIGETTCPKCNGKVEWRLNKNRIAYFNCRNESPTGRFGLMCSYQVKLGRADTDALMAELGVIANDNQPTQQPAGDGAGQPPAEPAGDDGTGRRRKRAAAPRQRPAAERERAAAGPTGDGARAGGHWLDDL